MILSEPPEMVVFCYAIWVQQSFYFYDLETSGISPREARIMQFAGQRTDMGLKPIGEPDNILIKLTPDILPDPDAVLITGITPQQTHADGITEAEFLRYFYENIALPGTIFTGFNTVRFDDEFMRYLNYRNFYDAYEWQWQDGRSKWDMLDVVRMTRALRPDGITWPFDSSGKPSNRLELLTSVNKLDHYKAHDALSDVHATIAVASLIQQKQPKLFEYLLKTRDKKEVERLVNKPEPFVYTSGRYSAEHEKTTIAVTVASHPTQKGSAYVYDLMHDPTPFANLSPSDLATLMQKYKFEEGDLRLPVKQLQFNRCPAVAPLAVLRPDDQKRLAIDMKVAYKHLAVLLTMGDFSDRLQEAARITEKTKQTTFAVDIKDVDAQLYDGFFNDADKTKMRIVRAADQNGLADLHLDFNDSRLETLLLLYKARQFPKSLTESEQQQWDAYKTAKLLGGDQQSRLARYFERINELAMRGLKPKEKYILEELKLYGESIAPYDA